MRKFASALAVTGLMLTAGAGAASADTVIFFNNPLLNSGGTITFGTDAGDNATLEDGAIDTVGNLTTLTGTAVTGTCGAGGAGCLDISTGVLVSDTTLGTTRTLVYSSVGSTLDITGSAAGGGPALFSTTFTGDIALVIDTVSDTGSLQGALNNGSLDATLAAFLGVESSTIGGTDNNLFIDVAFDISGSTGTGTVTENDVQTTSNAVPEPATLVMLGAGLAGLARRRFKAVVA